MILNLYIVSLFRNLCRMPDSLVRGVFGGFILFHQSFLYEYRAALLCCNIIYIIMDEMVHATLMHCTSTSEHAHTFQHCKTCVDNITWTHTSNDQPATFKHHDVTQFYVHLPSFIVNDDSRHTVLHFDFVCVHRKQKSQSMKSRRHPAAAAVIRCPLKLRHPLVCPPSLI